ncbi:hypothetical protein [Croceicoccus sp. BE223]|uniref:hypothetical protein n=1 Tax=Croceicoccus sp. BE223 TaxID=2817716 RepID=UPI00285DFA8D|nr:hypothetical protein [Croceicoccus sp. BE223]MDR7101995.1 protein involved in sex pheromone biosynthesis [Croceicoccus sp. BE223]
MRKTLTALIAATAALGLSACSERTEENAQDFAQKAADDTRDNAEVVENAAREGAIVAADKISEGAEKLQAKLQNDEQTDLSQGDGKLDGTD